MKSHQYLFVSIPPHSQRRRLFVSFSSMLIAPVPKYPRTSSLSTPLRGKTLRTIPEEIPQITYVALTPDAFPFVVSSLKRRMREGISRGNMLRASTAQK